MVVPHQNSSFTFFIYFLPGKWFKGSGAHHEEVDKFRVIERNFFDISNNNADSMRPKVHPRLLIYVKKGILKVSERLKDYVGKAGQMRSMGDASFESAETPEHYDEAKHYYDEAVTYDETLRPLLSDRMHQLEQIERSHKAQSYENQGDIALGKRRFKEAGDLYKIASRCAAVNSPTYARIREKEEYIVKIINLEIANHLAEKGEDFLRNGAYAQGREQFVQALKLNPEYIHLQTIIAGIDRTITTQTSAGKVSEANQAMKIGKYRHANQLFNEAIALVPERITQLKPLLDSLVVLMQGEDALMKQRSGLVALEDKKYATAIVFITEAISLLPAESLTEHAFFLCDRAQVHFEMKDYASSIADCNSALELRPELAIAFLRLGAAQFEMELYDDATVSYEKAIRNDPTLAEQVIFVSHYFFVSNI
jgi:tetratricopeptide (TPR) repeat protein